MYNQVCEFDGLLLQNELYGKSSEITIDLLVNSLKLLKHPSSRNLQTTSKWLEDMHKVCPFTREIELNVVLNIMVECFFFINLVNSTYYIRYLLYVELS